MVDGGCWLLSIVVKVIFGLGGLDIYAWVELLSLLLLKSSIVALANLF